MKCCLRLRGALGVICNLYNDLPEDLNCCAEMFADTKVYTCNANEEENCENLQSDLDKLDDRASSWQLIQC